MHILLYYEFPAELIMLILTLSTILRVGDFVFNERY